MSVSAEIAKVEYQDATGLVSVSNNLQAKAFVVRIVIAFASAVVLAPWLGIGWSAAWLAAVLVNEVFVAPMTMRYWIAPILVSNPPLSHQRSAVLVLYANIVQCSATVFAWLAGPDTFGQVAALMLGISVIYGVTYFRLTPVVVYVCVGVPGAIAVVMPFVTGQEYAWVYALSAITLLATCFIAMRHGNEDERAIDQLEERWRTAETASRAKSQFMATMSHELRTPLNAVIGFAEILEEEMDAAGRKQDASDAIRIHRAARTLLGLIEDVLDFSKIDADKLELVPEPVNVADLIREVSDTAGHIAIANGNRIETHLTPAQFEAVADSKRLRQCVLNLVSNACKFTENGRITISATKADDLLTITVADTGSGISQANLDKLFQPFVQGDGSYQRKHGGTGLGLVITQRLAQAMGGDVVCESELGVGSRFTLTVRDGVAGSIDTTQPLEVEQQAAA